ncbi:hypothetical protein NMY22_g8833 [Coprinellus aureogranulatus]|nr:hypothetical protein NMY22_g8833 [Coprinellus aureogranulatus]
MARWIDVGEGCPGPRNLAVPLSWDLKKAAAKWLPPRTVAEAPQSVTSIFKQSFLRLFNKDDQGHLTMGFNATFDIQVRHLQLGKKSPCVEGTEIGIGQTSARKINTISPRTSTRVYFEVVTPAGQALQQGSMGVIQFVTHYQHSSGQMRLRVTTITHDFAEAGSPSIPASFDQETGAVLMARIAKFTDYRKGDPTSFHLTDNFSIYPQFMFHLHRSQFLQVSNNLSDETAFYRHVLNEEDVNKSLIMTQSTLMSYTFDTPPQPVLFLNSISIKHE